MIVRRTIDKDELKELPKTVFPGRIYVIQSEAETERAVAYLQSRSVIGIDSETRPSFTLISSISFSRCWVILEV